MVKVKINSPKIWTPPPKSWSQALRAGNLLFTAGQVALTAKGNMTTGEGLVGKGDALAQARQSFKNIKTLVEKAGGAMEDIVKLTIYITDIRDADRVRKARTEFFTGDFPTATLVCVTALASPLFLVEIEAIAVLPDSADSWRQAARVKR